MMDYQPFFDAAIARAKQIDCFDFVASNPKTLCDVLQQLPAGKFCEWGSGIGIGTAVATMLGHQSCGIELSEPLAQASRELHTQFGIESHIQAGSYFDLHIEADYYFVYCWPSMVERVRQHFLETTPLNALLLFSDGADRIRLLKKDIVLAEVEVYEND